MADSDIKRNIVVLGGSIGGIGSVHYLLRHVIRYLPDHQVVLVSPNAQFLWRPACPRAAVREHFTKDPRLFTNIVDILKHYPDEDCRWIQGLATSVDVTTQTLRVRSAGGEEYVLSFEALIIATGASTASPLLGLTEDETRLKESWRAFQSALSSAKSIVIAGGGPAGVELAGELGSLLNRPRSFFQPAERNVSITLVTAGSQILPQLRPSIAETAEDYLAELGVTVQKNLRVQSVTNQDGDAHSHLTGAANLSLSDGSTIHADLYVPATGMTPNTSFMDFSFLADDLRVKVHPATLRVEGASPPIYAVGDASTYARPTVHGLFDAIPVMCAHLKRELLAASGATVEKTKSERTFKGDTSETQFVPIGSRMGVAAFSGWRLPSWLVSLVKGRDYLLWASSGIVSGSQWAKE